MKRAYLYNFVSIQSSDQLAIRTSLSLVDNKPTLMNALPAPFRLRAPIESLSLLTTTEFSIRIIGLNNDNAEVFDQVYESDTYGNFDIKVFGKEQTDIKKIAVYEVSLYSGIEILLGNFYPYQLKDPKKIIISDFDKTLLDTKWSSPKDMYRSLSKPMSHFPNIEKSIGYLKENINNGFAPFILSASPHFYENSIRDWLYQNQIYTDNIFLKDYRKIIDFFNRELTTKDMKNQGFYKLNQLVDILLMTGIPDELTLMGDSFETDSLIYLILFTILTGNEDTRRVWNEIKKDKSFKFTTKQGFRFLNKFYELGTKVRQKETPTKIRILIRCTEENFLWAENREIKYDFLKKHKALIENYIA
jgi:hypothetical protein